MSLEDISQLLLTHKINPNKLLGQNFMVEPSLYPKLCSYVDLTATDVVLDPGAGLGFMTRFLSDKCRAIIAVEKDPQLADFLHEQVKGLDNVTVIKGDVFKVALPHFNKIIAIPPYYLSSQLIIWGLEHRVDCAVMILQKEFANRLIAAVGSEEYSWLTVVAQQNAEVKLFDYVPKTLFYPQPEVDSVILRLKPWITKPFEVKNNDVFVKLVKSLFTERNKKLSKAILPFLKGTLKFDKQTAVKLAQSIPYPDRRVRDLSPVDFGAIANELLN
ncbi:MAG: 16S rRNA (adenine(1518)-N(6)/adenine(1519)-N(6))-dimethyltransferase RsmA [Candidatus Bathyarchaeota archaeon]|jgi:16S rRNA (adenine1518-N6/adenine1519-N6)-dimethyltransferase|nr:16S rRNA (adenine(1518)-N(6)/adenine(1519)-N(6))-dimethyltransferase RsmA [Candidatus Bathyarchaeota archaeon]MDD4326056.1 16S rRNA (adenine(1518)-N(6)/adenine(1519)-N(6))-dimethyltransferase RsmA [Candidatus Bathyarchaeota archaeon]MDI9576655.1 16S rRNA (adenine(1518)-N(6)/adenine(1519)-N(6))-dimethyltransferase RsmA [Thermoproteota archaeon]MDT8781705.1 ribosomal RNA small subunit methyltransferase A [Candidatus Bathyarchaeota archaeon]NLD65722.1 ribosomal RNA small subunit methyltransfera